MPPPRLPRLPRPGLAARAFVLAAGIVGAVLATVLVVASSAEHRAARDAARRGLEQAADLTAQLLAGRSRSLAGGARVFVQGPYFRSLVAERRRDDVIDQAFEAADQLEADWVFITDERGVLLAKSDEPGAAGDDLSGVSLVAGALGGGVTGGFGVSGDTLLFQTVGVPIVGPGAAPVGVLVATKVVDAQLARDIHAATAADVVFFTLDRQGGAHVAASTVAVPRATAALASSRGGAAGREAGPWVDDGIVYATQHSAVATAGGDVVGGFVVLRALESTPPGLAGVRRALLVAAALGLLLALGVGRLVARRVARPALALHDAAYRALAGDYSTAAARASAAVMAGPADEMARLGDALGALAGELRDRQRLAAALGAGASAGRTAAMTSAMLPAPPPQARTAAVTIAAPTRTAPTRGAAARRGTRAPAAASVPAVTRPPRIGSALLPGDVLAGRYAVQAELGAGGIGIVYLALDLAGGKPVALKTLRPELLDVEPQALERLARELQLAQRVAHRNVVRHFEFGESDGVPFMTMEYVDGPSLATLLRVRGPLDEAATIALARQLARALDAAHGEGVVHGDLKPSNLLVGADGALKVTDFGVARLTRRPRFPDRDPADQALARISLVGAAVGTPEYMAPELLLGGLPDVRADLYAVGVVLHECVSGCTPFSADTPRTLFARKLDPVLQALPERARGADAPRTLDELVARLTARYPEARPSSAAEFSALLERLG